MSKKILILSAIYPADDIPKTFTPVVHYFTREWVKLGYEVRVINYKTVFPKIFYWFLNFVKNYISSKVGYTVMGAAVTERNYTIEGVNVCRICLKKLKPHGRFPAKEVENALSKTVAYCNNSGFYPDVIISHWSNPQLDIMCRLKEIYKVTTCYIAHDAGHFNEYGSDAKRIWKAVDLVGYRSLPIKRSFETCPDYIKPSFMCYSGIPTKYNLNTVERTFDSVKRVAYVGALVERKHPILIIQALVAVSNNDFILRYAGEGQQLDKIKALSKSLNVADKVFLLGRLNRDDVIKLLDDSDMFIMISENETYGLVYLEAMARGCITIASRNEGFDGIIQDGVNGFLCEAGNVNELSRIIYKIKSMSSEERRQISINAMKTAKILTDKEVASNYICHVLGEKM